MLPPLTKRILLTRYTDVVAKYTLISWFTLYNITHSYSNNSSYNKDRLKLLDEVALWKNLPGQKVSKSSGLSFVRGISSAKVPASHCNYSFTVKRSIL